MRIDRMDETLIDVPRGLTNVAVAETAISDVHGVEGWYQYRDRDAVELARSATFEEVWRLLVHGAGAGDVRAPRDASPGPDHDLQDAIDAVAALPAGVEPVAGLRAVLPLWAGAIGMRPVYDVDESARTADADRIVAATPVVLAALYRRSIGREPLPPAPHRGLAANYLLQVAGALPDDRAERALTAYLVAAMDHGFNASTFTARVIASTGADMAACVAGALGALTGPLHGGAPARALDALDAVVAAGADRSPERWICERLERGERLMGFGHAVYRTVDPRSALLKECALAFGGPRVEAAVRFEETAERVLEELKPGRGLHANVEFYAAVVMEACGIPRSMLTATFATARTVGWTAHVVEQARDPKIIRPSARFVG